MENKNKKNIFEQIQIAISNPTKYKELVELPSRRFILYVFITILFITTITTIIPTMVGLANIRGLKNFFENKLPQFSYDGKSLESEDILDMNLAGFRIYMDTSKEAVDKDIVSKSDLMVITLGSNQSNIYLNSVDEVTSYMSFNYDKVLKKGFNNETLSKYTGLIYVYIIVTIIFTLIFSLIKYLILALILAIIVDTVNRRNKLGFKFGQLFMMGFYAQTIGILIVNINIAIGGFIPSLIMSCIGLFVAARFIMIAVTSKPSDNGNGRNEIFN